MEENTWPGTVDAEQKATRGWHSLPCLQLVPLQDNKDSIRRQIQPCLDMSRVSATLMSASMTRRRGLLQ